MQSIYHNIKTKNKLLQQHYYIKQTALPNISFVLKPTSSVQSLLKKCKELSLRYLLLHSNMKTIETRNMNPNYNVTSKEEESN
jgi:hypothetical protein